MGDIANTKIKKRWKLNLRIKFILLICIVLIMVFEVMSFLLLKNAKDNLTDSLNRETKAFAALATNPIGDYYELHYPSEQPLIKQRMRQYSVLNPNISNIAVISLRDLSQLSLMGKPIDVSTDELSKAQASTRTNSRKQITLVVQPYMDTLNKHNLSVAFEVSPALVNQAIRSQELTILLMLFLGLLLCVAATYLFINRFFLTPINSLSESAKLIAEGKLERSDLDQRTDEIGALAGSINNMASALRYNIAKLQELDVQKDEFIKIVSHNLRTPLTIIQSNAAFLDNAQLTPILKKMVDGIEDSARRLNLFSEQILTITDFESGKNKKSILTQTSLNEILGGLSREYGQIADSKRIEFKTDIQGGETRFLSSQYLIAQAVRNLLDNAIKFTPEQGIVELSAGIGQKVVITVKDTGIGIKPEEFPKLFTKFHRANDTMVYNYEGTGIGLYVTKLIIDGQGGTISARSHLGEGSVFTIELPFITPDKKPQEQQLSSR